MKRKIILSIANWAKKITPKSVKIQIARVSDYLNHGPASQRFPSIEATFLVLSQMGFRPRRCVDAGAYQGEWTDLCKRVFPCAEIIMIEPQESKTEILTKIAHRYGNEVRLEIGLLGASEGQTVSFIEMETGSSVFEEESGYARQHVTKVTQTLDSILRKQQWDSVDLIKLDVQGFELEILKGASNALKSCEVVLLEASLIPINKGCPLIAEVMRFMDERGFRLFDFCSQFRRNDGTLWVTDLLFVASRSSFVPEARLTHENWGN